MMRKIYLSLLIGFCVYWTAPLQAENPIQYKIIIQVSEDSVDRLNQAVNNASHFLDRFGYQHVEIKIIVLGAGVLTLRSITPYPLPDRIKYLHRLGVAILADQPAMKKAHLKPTDMLPEVRYIESGLVEIIEKQREGWAYIRP
ncbi:DsrE family protein [Magnetococcales bacterium HHB-1]